MKKILILITVLFGLTFADALQKDYAYVISAIGIKNVEGNVVWQSGNSNQLADGTYKLAPQVIVYDGKTEYVGAATPFTGCLNGRYYNSAGAPDGACFTGGVATSSQNGLMSAADKAKLDGINLSNYALASHAHDDRYYTEAEIDAKISSAGVNASDVLKLVYPVGSIYMSVNNVSPASFLGGTWEQLKDRFLLGAGSSYKINETGGEASHVLTTSELPSHNHTLNNHTHSIPSLSGSTNSSGEHQHYIMRNAQVNSSAYSSNVNNSNYVAYATNPSDDYEGYITRSSNSESNVGLTNKKGGHTHNVTTKASTTGGNNGNTSSIGSNQAHNNMPPYLAVYMWKRTA